MAGLQVEGYAPVGDNQLYFRLTGNPAGELLVFCHALFLSGDQFAPQVAEFSPRYRCLVWDQRGHGRTTSQGKFDFWDSARDLLGLLDYLGVPVAESIFGSSQGGMVAMRAAILAPTRFRSLVILGSSADEEDPETRAVWGNMRDVWVSEGIDGVVQKVSYIALGNDIAADERRTMEARMAMTPTPIVGGQDVVDAVVSRDNITDQLSRIEHIPTLVFHGDQDMAYPVEKGQEIFDLMGNKSGKSKMVVVPGAPHFLNITNAEALVDPIEKFLADVGLTPEEAGIDTTAGTYDPSTFNMQIKPTSPYTSPVASFGSASLTSPHQAPGQSRW
ncbi:Alpha/Beta hydrolase protein [Hyaloraphidium curvatum]|nr:Alpha/Beta hydrolase protein [Hyaloraphidium curvatum]